MPSYEEVTTAGQAAESFLRNFDSKMEARRAENSAGSMIPDVASLQEACQKDGLDDWHKLKLLALDLTPGIGCTKDEERAKERQHFLTVKAFALSTTPMTEDSALTDKTTVDVDSSECEAVLYADGVSESHDTRDRSVSDRDKYSVISGGTHNSFGTDQLVEDDDFVVLKKWIPDVAPSETWIGDHPQDKIKAGYRLRGAF